jgi:hypothetical protein
MHVKPVSRASRNRPASVRAPSESSRWPVSCAWAALMTKFCARGAERRDVRAVTRERQGWGSVGHREDEERYDALEGPRLEDQPELLLVSYEAGSRLSLFLGMLCSLPEVLCELIALILRLDAEIVYPT